MKKSIAITFLALTGALCGQGLNSFTLPTNQLLSQPGPTFTLREDQLPSPLVLITYGDQRFTDPANTESTNPRIRQYLVNQIAAENAAAVLMNGDVPLQGDRMNDYRVFQTETKIWRDAHLNVYPTLGNHEFQGDPQVDLDNWWTAFPELRNRRWYSAQLGSRVYLMALDSGASLLPGSDQARWYTRQVEGLPPSIDFVIVTLHHPPVSDPQLHLHVDHNVRDNEIALRDYLSKVTQTSRVRFLVSAGHIHNYERNVVAGITYLVTGGGGAPPYFVERTPGDFYKSINFPNYHYVKLTLEKDHLHGAMYRVADPEAAAFTVEPKDSFDIPMKPR